MEIEAIFFSILNRNSSGPNKSVVVILDARQGCWRLLRASTEQVQATLANNLAAVWALKPEPFWEKQHVECVKSRQDFKVRFWVTKNLARGKIDLKRLFQIQYLSLAKLHKLVELDQLPEELGGGMPYQHRQWVKNRLRLETFLKRTQMVLADLGEVRGQLERGCDLQKSDGGFRMMDWMLSVGALYRNCLANVRKVEQNGERPPRRKFPATFTCQENVFDTSRPSLNNTLSFLQAGPDLLSLPSVDLLFYSSDGIFISISGRKLFKQLETDEESGFRLVRHDGSVTEYTAHCQRQVQDSLAGIRGRIGEAEQLYAELQGGIHHARSVRTLEAGMESVTSWVLGEGADLLRQLILRGIGQDPDTVAALQQELEQLELKCRVI